MSIYLAKYIALCGAAARRKAAELVKTEGVTVNGSLVYDPAYPVIPGQDAVQMHGTLLAPPEQKIYIMLHKPRGYTTSHADRHAQKLAIDLVDCPKAKRLIPAGRLDQDSEGLLIFSNDGDFIQHLAHPRYQLHKRYEVTSSITLAPEQLAQLEAGIMDDGDFLKALRVTPVAGKRNAYSFELAEGKKREIRRMLKFCGARTLRLIRLAAGAVELGDLACGKWRYLTEIEVRKLREQSHAPTLEPRNP